MITAATYHIQQIPKYIVRVRVRVSKIRVPIVTEG